MEYQHGGDIYSQDIQMDYSAISIPSACRRRSRRDSEGLPGEEVCSLYRQPAVKG